MKFWKDNRLDRKYDVPWDKIVKDYMKSDWVECDWPIERKLRAFLLDYGTYEEKDYAKFYHLVRGGVG